MKKLLLIALVLIAFASCKKENDDPANFEVTVTYYYNTYVGYKNDVAATAFIFEKQYGDLVCLDSMSVISAKLGMLYDKNGEKISNGQAELYTYKSEANAQGLISLSGLKPGKYFLIVSSKGRYTYSSKFIELLPGQTLKLTKNFGYSSEYDHEGEYWN